MRVLCNLAAVLAALVVVTHATDLEDKVAKTIDDFKAMMPFGRPDLNIPILEPVTIKSLPLSIKASPFNAKVVASNIQVAGASSFELTQLSQVGESSQVKIAVEVPRVDVTGDYEIHGQVKVGFIKVKLNSHGPLTIGARGLKGAGVADIISNDDGSIHLNNIKINDWSYDQLSVNLENVFDGGVMSKTVNKLINKLIPEFASANNAKLTTLLESLAMKYVNKYLDGVATNVVRLDSVAQARDWIVTQEVQGILDQLAVAITAPAEEDNFDLEEVVSKLSEDFRVAMKKGREDIGIAPMDPAIFSDLTINFQKWLLSGQAVASNLRVSGGSDFKLIKVSALDDTHVAIEYNIPALTLTGNYALDAQINLGITKVHSIKSGSLTLTATGVTCTATAQLVVDNNDQLLLSSYNVDSWSYERLAVQLDNPSEAGFIKKKVNQLIGELIPSLLIKPYVKDLTVWASNRGFSLIGRFIDAIAGRIPIFGLAERALVLLQDLQAVMVTGSSDFGLPMLDPFTLNEVPFSFSQFAINASIVAKNFQVGGTSAFDISRITQMPDSNTITIDLEVPEIHGSSAFEATFSIKYPRKNITDNGSLTALLQGLKVSATALLGEDAMGALLLKELRIDTWSYAGVTASFANLKDHIAGRLVNDAINLVLPQIISVNKNAINTWAEETAKAVLDQYLAGVAQASSASVVDLRVIPAEARQIIMSLAALAA